jgi:hypothetical protein
MTFLPQTAPTATASTATASTATASTAAAPTATRATATRPTRTPDSVAAPAATGGARTRVAAVLAALVRRIDRAADARARRKAAQMSAAELARLPETVRMELGLNGPEGLRPSPFVQGLVGPAAYWAPSTGRPRRGDAKN